MSNAVTSRVNTVKHFLDAMKDKMAEVLPKHMTADRLVKTALIALNKTPKIAECSQSSLAQSLMTAAELGLDVSGTLGSAYLIPYGQTCQLIVGYRGLIDLARRSGHISSIEAHIVHANDTFRVKLGTDSGIDHVPNFAGERGEAVAVYAVAKLTDGGIQFDVMTRDDVEKIRSKSRAGKSGPWVDHWNEMAKKTVVRRLCKYLPLSVEMEKAMSLDADDETEVIRDVLPETPRAVPERKMDRLASRFAEPEPDIDPDTGEIVPPPSDSLPGMDGDDDHQRGDMYEH